MSFLTKISSSSSSLGISHSTLRSYSKSTFFKTPEQILRHRYGTKGSEKMSNCFRLRNAIQNTMLETFYRNPGQLESPGKRNFTTKFSPIRSDCHCMKKVEKIFEKNGWNVESEPNIINSVTLDPMKGTVNFKSLPLHPYESYKEPFDCPHQ